ncbi:MAG: magnesium transporter [Saccharofermentans sp.]|jgi:magnesium transporter|nr:magnesium transporter [Clostridiales bacterium]MCR5384269.1 magnesium transporter [Saccharofermentans sp.]
MAEKEIRRDYQDEIISLMRGNDSPRVIHYKLEDYHASDIAQILEELNDQERKKLFRVCGKTLLAEAFECLEEEQVGAYINEMDIRRAAAVIAELETDTAANVLRELEKERRGLIIDALDTEVRKEISIIASYDEDEIGSKMTANFITIGLNLTVKQAMSALVTQAEENDNISTLFVEDDEGLFYGALTLKDLITARSTTDLNTLIVTSFPYVYATEQIDDCIEKLKDYSEDLIPVLDEDNKILGVITSQSIVEVVDDELGEDYVKLAGLIAEEDLKEPLGQSIRKRMPWLLILLCLGMLVSSLVGVFESVIAHLTIIMAFQSLILDMAGNVGTQSLAVTIRVLTDENLTFGQKFRLVIKESKVGLSVGLILGAASIVLIGIYLMVIKQREAAFAFSVSGCIGVALLISMICSSIIGTLIPLFFKRIKVDPAVASGPLITTVNDLVAVACYYGISWILLINVMNF